MVNTYNSLTTRHITGGGRLCYYSQFLLILLLLTFTAVISFFRSYYRVPRGDEGIYEYVWEKDDHENLWNPKHRYERKIESFADVIQSQVMHYRYSNGRSLVHAGEQLFTNHKIAFGIVNSLIFISFIILIVYFVNGNFFSLNYNIYFLTLLCLVFLMQSGLWVSINTAPNYLWPAFLSMIIIISWQMLERGNCKSYSLPLIILFSFCLGWSHEAYSIPIIGGGCLFYLLNPKKYNKRVLWVFIPLIIGAIILVLSPGNYGRLGEKTRFETIRDAFVHLTYLKIIWIMIFGVFILLFQKHKIKLKEFLRSNSKLFLILIVSFLFTLVANTGPWTNTFMELIALLIILRYIKQSTSIFESKWLRIICVTITCLFIPQQILVAKDTISLYHYQKASYEDYINSPDGYVKFSEPKYSFLSEPLLPLLKTNRTVFSAKIHLVNGTPTKIPLFLSGKDYPAIEFSDSFYIPENRVAGTAPVYHIDGGEYYWIYPDSINNSKAIIVNWKPVDWNHDVILLLKLMYLIRPNAYPLSQSIVIDTIPTRFGDRYRININRNRQIERFDTLKNIL